MNGGSKKKRGRAVEWWLGMEGEVNIECTGCGTRVQKKNALRSHPLLEVPICRDCLAVYNHGEFDIEQGQEIYCRWCGNGGELVCCDTCPKSFCRACIRRNFLGREEQRILRDADVWQCFCCDPLQMDEWRRKMAYKWKIPNNQLQPPKQHPRYAHTTAAQIEAGMANAKGKKRRDAATPPIDPRFIVDHDLSLGRERVPICVVNEVDDAPSPADTFKYVTRHVASETMHLNTNPAYLVGCDCTDGCRDPTKCRCAGHMGNAFAYTDKGQLLEPRMVVYECNELCRCHLEGCKNRVVGKGLQLRLEVFRCKEVDKGWGVRCLDQIPAGTFVTDYLGEILREQDAEKRGLRKGDQYLFSPDLWASDVARWRLERLGIKDGSGFEADGTPVREASPPVSPRSRRQPQQQLELKRKRKEEEEEEEEEDRRAAPFSQLTQEELAELKDVYERAVDVNSQDFAPMEPLSLSGIPSSAPTVAAASAPASQQQSSQPSQERGREEEQTEVDKEGEGSADSSDETQTATEGGGSLQPTRKGGRAPGNGAQKKRGAEADADAPAPTPEGLLASMRALEQEADEAEQERRAFAAQWGMDLSVRGRDSLRREAERLLDRTRDECESNDLGFSIDAQWYGNVARFLNHSCDPNLIKQIVFVETHDVRVPRVAFFALFDIPAREELTYDYGYMTGSVQGKSLPCLCGASDCRKTLY